MARICEVCAKKGNPAWTRVKLRGKYNPTAKHVQQPNLQWIRLLDPFARRLGIPSGSRVKACTKCIKALSKT